LEAIEHRGERRVQSRTRQAAASCDVTAVLRRSPRSQGAVCYTVIQQALRPKHALAIERRDRALPALLTPMARVRHRALDTTTQ